MVDEPFMTHVFQWASYTTQYCISFAYLNIVLSLIIPIFPLPPFFDFSGFRCIFQIVLRVSSLNIIDP
jgi:hypothetical protein